MGYRFPAAIPPVPWGGEAQSIADLSTTFEEVGGSSSGAAATRQPVRLSVWRSC